MSYNPVSFHKGTTVVHVPHSWTTGAVSCEGRRTPGGQEYTLFKVGGREFSIYEKGEVFKGDDGGISLPSSHVENWDTAQIFGVSGRTPVCLDKL